MVSPSSTHVTQYDRGTNMKSAPHYGGVEKWEEEEGEGGGGGGAGAAGEGSVE